MIDWSASMIQTFEYYTVDPESWKDDKKLSTVTSCTINRDSSVETLGSATIDITETIGECYVRVYLVAIQNGVTYKHPLGTFLIQTPSSKFDGRKQDISMDAYTPLIELKENQPPLGYSISKNMNIMDNAYLLCRDNLRAPVVRAKSEETLYSDFVSNTDDTWMTFVSDLIANANFLFDLDEMGRVLFAPQQEVASLQPLVTFDDGNSSILYPDISVDHDLYDIPNAVEVIYSKNGDFYYAKVINDDPNSPISTVNRGREINHRVSNPEILGVPSDSQVQDYATRLLRELSTIEYTVSYSHGFYPVRIGDCVRLNYERAGINNIKAKIISQSIKCESGCQVSEKAVFTVKLWR